jgi:hypothetical protein
MELKVAFLVMDPSCFFGETIRSLAGEPPMGHACAGGPQW